MNLLRRLLRGAKRSTVVVPYTDLAPETAKAVARYGPLLMRMRGTENYWRLLRACWEQGETFVIVEHDVVPHRGAIESLMGCDHDWCAFPYMVAGRVRPALGCTKFSASLVTRHPDLMEAIGDKERHWSMLDAYVQVGLEMLGERVHVHEPAVEHLNPDAEVPILPADAKLLRGVLKAREMDREIMRIDRLKAEGIKPGLCPVCGPIDTDGDGGLAHLDSVAHTSRAKRKLRA